MMRDDLRGAAALRLLQSADELRDRLSGAFAAVHGLSVNEFLLLMHLERAGENTLSRVELAKRLFVSASTVTRMIAPMEKIGLVSREVAERDARLALVNITKAGAEKLKDAKLTFKQHASYAFEDRWSNDDIATLSDLLHRFVAGRTAHLT